jgi:predicted secreted hydrolase
MRFNDSFFKRIFFKRIPAKSIQASRLPGWLQWSLLLAGFITLAIPLAMALGVPFKQALPGFTYHFPQDHAAHPDFKTEWWYYTGHLQTASHQRYGYELTFFRIGREQPPEALKKVLKDSPWTTRQLYAAHFALSDETGKRFQFSEKLNRMGIGIAGAHSQVCSVWNELWRVDQLGSQMVLQAQFPDGKQSIHLLLSPEKPVVIHGKNGVSQKAGCVGCASHYYSFTRLKTEGNLMVDGKIQPVTGLSWMDHEFGSNQLAARQAGWDWFSVQLNDNTELMLYLLRNQDGSIDPNSSGTMVPENGQARHLTLKDFQVKSSGKKWLSKASGGLYPMDWQIDIPSEKLGIAVTPTFENQELQTTASTTVAYWEGSVTVSGTRNGKAVKGQGYVEMTGYAKQGVQGKL